MILTAKAVDVVDKILKYQALLIIHLNRKINI